MCFSKIKKKTQVLRKNTYLKDSWIQLKLNKVKYTSTRESYIPASIVAEEISICMEETLSSYLYSKQSNFKQGETWKERKSNN